MLGETIAAISTPIATGGISVIRVSGEEAIDICEKVLHTLNGELLKTKRGYTAALCEVFSLDENGEKSEKLDDCVVTIFRAPKSYTGENVVEISCHGGVFNTREILRWIIIAGARNAAPGEFSKRAFLNGKMSLTQAEAVITMIDAKNHQALSAARAQLDGSLQKRLVEISNKLLNCAGSLCAFIDYPEEDITPIEREELFLDMNTIEKSLSNLVDTFDKGKLVFEGINTVICGKPNVGKSTLMNLLSGSKKSIVTEIAGTTRDVVEETVNIGDVMLRLCDTAGIRETADVIEAEGVNRARERMENAQLILCMFDGSAPLDDIDTALISDISKKSVNTAVLAILNKSDLVNQIEVGVDLKIVEALKAAKIDYISLSALNETGIDKLQTKIMELTNLCSLDLGAGILQNERQYEAAVMAMSAVKEAARAIKDGVTLDAITVLVEAAIEEVFALSGKRVTAEVVDNVFSHFCVGK